MTVAVTPDVAAKPLAEWVETFGMDKTGQYWAPRGAADIGTAESVLGPKDKLPTPLQLPWWSLPVDEGREGGGWIELGFVTVRPVSWSHEYYEPRPRSKYNRKSSVELLSADIGVSAGIL